MFEIEMVLAFSKLSHQKEIQPRKKKVPCSSFGTASRKKTIQCRLKDPIWRTFTHYMVSKQMWHRNLPRRRPKRNAAPVSRVTWKEKKIMSNAILPETEQIWKKIHEMWKFLKMTISEQESHQMCKFLKRKITEKKSHQIWWFLKRTNLKRFNMKCESSWIGTCLKRNHIIYHIW